LQSSGAAPARDQSSRAQRRTPTLGPGRKRAPRVSRGLLVAGRLSRSSASAPGSSTHPRSSANNGLGGRSYKTRKRVDKRVAQIITTNIEGLITTTTATRNGKPTLSWARNDDAIAVAARTDGIYALATNLPGRRLTASQVLRTYKGQQIVERRHRDYKQTLQVRPIFLHNDDRIHALTSTVGIGLLIFGLIETELRKRLHEHESLPGLLPEGRAAQPTGRTVLSAFQGLGLTTPVN